MTKVTTAFSPTYRVKIPLPPAQLRLEPSVDGGEFAAAGVRLATLCYGLGLRDEHEILDVGCSIGRLAIGLLSGTGFRGRYVGFDVQPKQVRWARDNIQPVVPGFHFRHADVRNARYNPKGTIEPRDFRFPVRNDAFDFATLFSIFTHFYAEDVEIYLHELRRVLRPGGTVLATWFLYDENTLDAATTTAFYPMMHRLDDDTIYNDAEDPLRAIAHREGRVREMVAAAGLEIVTVEHGTWNDGPGPEFQDVVVLRRPEPPAQPVRGLLAGARRVLGRLRRRLRRVAGLKPPRGMRKRPPRPG